MEPKNSALELRLCLNPRKMWASPKKSGVRYEQGFFLEVRKRSIWDSLKRSRLSEGSFPDRVGRGSLPTAQTAMYPWEKPS